MRDNKISSALAETFKQYSAEFQSYSVVGNWPMQNFHMMVDAERNIMHELISTFTGEYVKAFLQRIELHVDYSWPENWWEAVKERWAPHWFKKRWPVQYVTVKHDIDEPQYAIAPHHYDRGQCLQWMARQIEQGYASHQEIFEIEGVEICGCKIFVECNHDQQRMVQNKMRHVVEEFSHRYS